MNIIKTSISDVLLFEPKIYNDDRGFFFESFNQKIFEEAIGHEVNFVQDNHSKSCKGVLRGLHFQKPPFAQGKLVRCIVGEVYDVAVDLRIDSSTYGKWVGYKLSADNKRQLWIPEGFAHGFVVLSDNAEFVYKTTNYYNPCSDAGLIWNDEKLNISWPNMEAFVLSDKDMNLPTFDDYSKDNCF
ncbi:dTDP-4-dehydrorhamnose 3,5-epimerase [Enterobacter hormaechei subsp. xiangfangensis]|uniref:dTDP-4-dehydrorhamnose 3,5-epimerase n=1 Tax=Enterobacter TaxID=547 RepID=UPI0006513813|nr:MULTISPECIES: dTDP-4-dehydrorhamnose 3,5-epimerase [Enterobacter cloacae complex]HAV1836095.1 dTDP-4-dehydrorhamnose 3,5-epimerase [Enterobacter hormaechei subsp. steigerwaltii]KLW61336.1 dTDP-4-dehydrorhamnose 3,5-epimerase [Enterobacter sp. BIDMC93]KTQ52000.1 dTDP-4-dehydrorhamnose 3,5-epimerase [Enterobacter hormaechei]KTQ53886.1 dTDP-4-dehydrorhamnose 3,5-epimerase [Enterobacter hormaechei]KTQ59256.1 dTDP-4-dehydrorhamnose 3,5-epimerase [Enterobacter hormaechei subsp. xiangfangensis]